MSFSDADVGLLTSSAQIFASNHTLPQIRAIHKALHVQIDDKAARLRTQVGGSYRELLGAADTIVQMRGDMDTVHTTLAGMGTRCGHAVVGGKVAALAAFVDHAQEQSALSLAARVRLLEACMRTAGRLLAQPRRDRDGRQQQQQQPPQKSWGERLVLAAKVLVLGRLLLSGLGEEPAAAAPPTTDDGASRPKRRPRYGGDDDDDAAALRASIAASKKTLGSLRRRLQDIVELVARAVPAAVMAPAPEDASNSTQAGAATATTAAAAAAGRDDLLRALCAHSLTTTSGVRDVLWHLLHVRGQAMALAFDFADGQREEEAADATTAAAADTASDAAWKRERVLRGLALYTKTLLDVQALVPHRLPDALLALKKRALLDDEALRGLESLQLDVYARWAGDDVRFFKPYLRHDDLDAAQARAMLAKWAERGADVLLAGLRAALADHDTAAAADTDTVAANNHHHHHHHHHYHHHALDLPSIVSLRTRVLRLWIRDGSRARGLDPSALLDQLRAVFNEHLQRVLSAKAAKLRLVGAEVAAALAGPWPAGDSGSGGLWAAVRVASEADDRAGGPDRLNTDLSDADGGAVPFVRDVVARLHGRSDAVARAVASYATWRRVVDDAAAAVAQLRRQRWDNDADDLVEDEDTLAARQQRLSRDDPQTLLDQLQAAVAAAVQALDAQITAAWETTAAAAAADADADADADAEVDASPAQTGRAAVYLVRVLREIRRAPPAVLAGDHSGAGGPGGVSLGLGIIPALHAALARAVVAAPLEQFATTALTRTTVAGRLLWDGADDKGDKGADATAAAVALPSSPSPGVFQFLRALSTAMGRAGMDLWSPAAVAELKQQAVGGLGARWTTVLQTAAYLRPEAEAGDEDKDKDDDDDDAAPATRLPDDQRRDLLLQWFFDLAWLRCGLEPAGADGSPLAQLQEQVYARAGLADGAAGQRMATAAQASWKKTRLLFGLL